MTSFQKLFLSFLVLLVSFIGAIAQDNVKTPHPLIYQIGVQPAVTVEPFDEYRNSIEVNLIPLVLEYAFHPRWSFRVNPIWNLQIRPEFPAEFSQLGASITLPYHFSKKNSEEGHRGFYVGPNFAYSKHLIDNFNSTTLGVEVGYAFIFNRIFSVTVGAQGGTTLATDNQGGYGRIMTHSGAIFSFGMWL